MRTKQEIANILYRKRRNKALSNIGVSDVASTFASLSVQHKKDFARELISGDGSKAGILLKGWVSNHVIANVKAEVDAMLADDTLDLAELDNIL